LINEELIHAQRNLITSYTEFLVWKKLRDELELPRKIKGLKSVGVRSISSLERKCLK